MSYGLYFFNNALVTYHHHKAQRSHSLSFCNLYDAAFYTGMLYHRHHNVKHLILLALYSHLFTILNGVAIYLQVLAIIVVVVVVWQRY